uniref:Protein kinase domain-containing protein n=1 Tax=Populus davidiana TaxID=266767 RepID=A0A6M2EDM6_9ROSI
MTNHRNPKRPVLPLTCTSNLFSQECASNIDRRQDDAENIFYQELSCGNFPVDKNGEQSIPHSPRKPRACKKIPVTVTTSVRHSKHSNGRKMINEYVKESRINQGSYGKVVLYRNINSGTPYAIKVICKSRLRKFRISGSETAMADVLREVRIRVSLMYFFVFMYAQTQGLPFLLIMLLCCFILSFFLVRLFRVPSTVIPHLAATFLKQAKSSMSCNNSDMLHKDFL